VFDRSTKRCSVVLAWEGSSTTEAGGINPNGGAHRPLVNPLAGRAFGLLTEVLTSTSRAGRRPACHPSACAWRRARHGHPDQALTERPARDQPGPLCHAFPDGAVNAGVGRVQKPRPSQVMISRQLSGESRGPGQRGRVRSGRGGRSALDQGARAEPAATAHADMARRASARSSSVRAFVSNTTPVRRAGDRAMAPAVTGLSLRLRWSSFSRPGQRRRRTLR